MGPTLHSELKSILRMSQNHMAASQTRLTSKPQVNALLPVRNLTSFAPLKVQSLGSCVRAWVAMFRSELILVVLIRNRPRIRAGHRGLQDGELLVGPVMGSTLQSELKSIVRMSQNYTMIPQTRSAPSVLSPLHPYSAAENSKTVCACMCVCGEGEEEEEEERGKPESFPKWSD